MSKTPVLAAVSAALLALAVPAYGTEGVTQRIKEEQYSGFVSGASFCTSTPDFEVWTSARETWTAPGGFGPRYWSGTAGASMADSGDRAPDGSYYYYSSEAWRKQHQPPVYGRVGDDQAYSSLYRRTDGSKTSLVDIDTSTAAPVVCRFAEEGDVAAADGSDIFFDANVTLEAFAYGEANRPDDSVLAPDAKLAIYMQDTTPDGSPGFFIVARDWNTGAAQHYRVWGGGYGWSQHQPYHDPHRYSGRIVIRAVRSVHKGKFDPVVPAFLVYLTDGRSPLGYDPDGYGRRPDAGEIQWDSVRDDFGDWYSDYIPFFQPLTEAHGMRLSKVSYGGGVRLGAYAVGTVDPLRTTVRWAADSGMIRLLSVDGTDIDGLRWVGSAWQYQGTEDVDAGAYTYYRDLYYDYSSSGNVRGSVSWRGVNGWSDGRYDMTPGGGCEIALGTNCFQLGRASLDTFEDAVSEEDIADLEEWISALEEDVMPHAASRVRGTGRYADVPEALAHAAVVGGTVKLLAYPMAPLVMPPLESDVTVDLNGHAVPGDWEYAMALGLDDYTGGMEWVDAAGFRGGVVAYPASGRKCTFALRGGSSSSVYDDYVYGGLSVTGVSLRVTGVHIRDFSQICNSPGATVNGGFESSLYVTNTALSVTGGSVSYNEYDSTAPAFMTNTALRVEGGSLSISGGEHGRVVVADVPSVSISGGKLAGLELHNSAISRLGGEIGGNIAVSNNPAALTVSGTMGGRLDVADAGAVAVEGGATLNGISVERVASLTIARGSQGSDSFGDTYYGPNIYARDIVARDTPVSIHGGRLRNFGVQGQNVGDTRVEVYGGTVFIAGLYTGACSGTYAAPYAGVPVVVISNSPAATVASGTFYSHAYDDSHYEPKYAGVCTVYDSPVVVYGGGFCDFTAVNASSVVISNSPAFRGNFAVSSTGSVSISGSPTFGPDSLVTRQWHSGSGGNYWYDAPITPPTFKVTAPDAVISGGTFRVKLEGSGIRVAGGRFYWGPNPKLDESGVVLPVAGKKLVRVGGNDPHNTDHWKNTYWEVRNE